MSEMVWQILLQIILILLNAFFAATEIAVISLNEKKLKSKAEDGNKKAAKMLKMVAEPTQFLSTIQVGITLAGFLGSAFAADNFAEKLSSFAAVKLNIPETQLEAVDTCAVIVITLILSFFTLVFGELVPKRIAMKHKEKFAEAVCGSISTLSVVLKPIIWMLSASTNVVLRLFGIDPYEKEEPVSQEDIVLMLDAGADEGSLDHNDIEYIKNVFKLDTMTAEDVMTHRRSAVIIPKTATREEILSIIEKEEYSRIPVYEETADNIIGILHTREFLLKYNAPDFKIEDALMPPTFVPMTAHLDVLFKNMQKDHKHLVVVINEYGEAAGILTMEDILEEIVGEIWDERDEAVESIEKISENVYRVLCSAKTDEFFEFFDLSPEEETESITVNGWMTEHIGKLPEQNDSFEYANLFIEVTKADDLMAHEISVTVREKAPEKPTEKKKSDISKSKEQKK